MTEVISHFLPFPFPVLCFIPIPMGFPWDSRYHWESHSHVHLYSNVLLLPVSRHWSLLASPFSKAICEHCESTDTGWCITWYACLLPQLSAATILSQTVYNDHQIQQFSIVFFIGFYCSRNGISHKYWHGYGTIRSSWRSVSSRNWTSMLWWVEW